MASLDKVITIRVPERLLSIIESAAACRYDSLGGEMKRPEVSEYIRWLIMEDVKRARKEIEARRGV